MSEVKPRIMPILREEAARNGYTVEELLRQDLHFRVVMVRQYAIWRARQETGRSFSEIGRVFKRDHTTIVHAVQRVEALPPEQRGVIPPKETLPPSLPPRVRLVTRKKAPAELYVGRPCHYGHGGLRYVSTRDCVECKRERTRLRWLKLAAE